MRFSRIHHIDIVTILFLLATTFINIGCSSFVHTKERAYADSLLNNSYMDIINYSFVKAYRDISRAQTFYEKTNNQEKQAICQIHLALLYEGIGLWEEAHENLKKARSALKQLSPIVKYRYYYANVVYLLEHCKNYAEAGWVMKYAIANDHCISNKVFLLTDLSNLAEIYIKQGKIEEASKILNSLDKQVNNFFQKNRELRGVILRLVANPVYCYTLFVACGGSRACATTRGTTHAPAHRHPETRQKRNRQRRLHLGRRRHPCQTNRQKQRTHQSPRSPGEQPPLPARPELQQRPARRRTQFGTNHHRTMRRRRLGQARPATRGHHRQRLHLAGRQHPFRRNVSRLRPLTHRD